MKEINLSETSKTVYIRKIRWNTPQIRNGKGTTTVRLSGCWDARGKKIKECIEESSKIHDQIKTNQQEIKDKKEAMNEASKKKQKTLDKEMQQLRDEIDELAIQDKEVQIRRRNLSATNFDIRESIEIPLDKCGDEQDIKSFILNKYGLDE